MKVCMLLIVLTFSLSTFASTSKYSYCENNNTELEIKLNDDAESAKEFSHVIYYVPKGGGVPVLSPMKFSKKGKLEVFTDIFPRGPKLTIDEKGMGKLNISGSIVDFKCH